MTKPAEEVQITQKYLDEEFDHDLFEILRSLRKRLADAEGMPSYIIFPDSSLKAMATYFPRTLSDFRRINGVGKRKLEKYGEVFLPGEEISIYKFVDVYRLWDVSDEMRIGLVGGQKL